MSNTGKDTDIEGTPFFIRHFGVRKFAVCERGAGFAGTAKVRGERTTRAEAITLARQLADRADKHDPAIGEAANSELEN